MTTRPSPAGQRVTFTTPSGQVVTYTYSNNRIVTISVNSTPLVTGMATEPFGPLNAWNWGNGLYSFRDYDNAPVSRTSEFW